MKKATLFFLLLTLFMACDLDDNNSELTIIESTLISKDRLFGNGEEDIAPQNIVITNQNNWNDLITQMNSVNNVSDNFSEIDISFSEYIVIAVFDELKGNDGHSIELSINSNSENIIVSVTNSNNEGNGATVITQPYHIVKIPTSILPIIFE